MNRPARLAPRLCRSLRQLRNLQHRAARFFNVYGPNQDPSSPYSGVISLFLEAVSDSCSIQSTAAGTKIPRLCFRGRRGEGPAPGDGAARVAADRTRREKLARVYNVCTRDRRRWCVRSPKPSSRSSAPTSDIRYGPPRQGDIGFSVGRAEQAASELGFHGSNGLSLWALGDKGNGAGTTARSSLTHPDRGDGTVVAVARGSRRLDLPRRWRGRGELFSLRPQFRRDAEEFRRDP